ncbi:MAG: hypothetical protein U1F43_05485 [Myxococcota bacterium]
MRAEVWCAGFVLAACGGDDDVDSKDFGGGPVDAVDAVDAVADATDAVGSSDGSDAADAPDVVIPALTVVKPIGPAPADPLAGSGLESCGVYQAEACDAGQLRRCDLYDTAAHAFVAEPDALIRRAYLYDRWYDLYHRPDGVTAERVFSGPTPAGTPESEWGAPARFDSWAGVGDGAIWTGAALNAAAFRYAATGTEADYARMVARTKDLLRLFDVTGIPGYLARHPFIHMEQGGPTSETSIVQFGAPGPTDHTFDPTTVPDMPAAYLDGIPDADGKLWKGTAMWQGNPSIDQYTGPMVAFPIAWSLLRDDAVGQDLKARMTRHLTCYLKRLRRIEVIHLQSNPDALAAVQQFLAGGALVLDPGDPDLTALDTVVAYALEQPNAANADTFDASCPEHPATAPTRVLDAQSDDFFLTLLDLVGDMSEHDTPRATAIDHVYAVNVRGGDASHIMHLAALSWLMTGDDQYRAFLEDELIGKLHVDQVTHTLGAFATPRWCRSYYGDHITFGPHWALVTTLGPGPLHDDMLAQMDVELRQKLMAGLANAKFDLMYASVAPSGPGDGAWQQAAMRDEGLASLDAFGGSGGVLDDPRRAYTLDRAAVIAALPDGVSAVCPTEAERTRCEAGLTVLGVTVPGDIITHACSGAPAECVMADGQCADPLASSGLPPTLRRYADFMWQRSPFTLGEHYDEEGREQSPGLDLVEELWLARAYGLTARGAGQVLAWKDAGSCR